jgi:hypothetical protein
MALPAGPPGPGPAAARTTRGLHCPRVPRDGAYPRETGSYRGVCVPPRRSPSSRERPLRRLPGERTRRRAVGRRRARGPAAREARSPAARGGAEAGRAGRRGGRPGSRRMAGSPPGRGKVPVRGGASGRAREPGIRPPGPSDARPGRHGARSRPDTPRTTAAPVSGGGDRPGVVGSGRAYGPLMGRARWNRRTPVVPLGRRCRGAAHRRVLRPVRCPGGRGGRRGPERRPPSAPCGPGHGRRTTRAGTGTAGVPRVTTSGECG